MLQILKNNRQVYLFTSLAFITASVINCDVGNLSRLERDAQVASLQMAERLSKFYGGMISEIQILYPQRYINQTVL
ncbi:MAG TPA: XRE family transcriptional regulator [Arsenophonus sp.]